MSPQKRRRPVCERGGGEPPTTVAVCIFISPLPIAVKNNELRTRTGCIPRGRLACLCRWRVNKRRDNCYRELPMASFVPDPLFKR